RDGRGTDLGKTIEAAEGELSALEHRRRSDWRQHSLWSENHRVTERDQFFGEARRQLSAKVSRSGDEPVINRRQPGRRGVSDPRKLQGRRFAGEYGQPVVGRMTGQVDQDIDPVA